jgi:hypothetical protein
VEHAIVGGAREENLGRTNLGKPGVVFFNQIWRHRASVRLHQRREPVAETTRKPVADAVSNRTDSADVVGRTQARGRWTADQAWGSPKSSSTTKSGERTAKGSRMRGGYLARERNLTGMAAVEVFSSREWRRRMRAGIKS